jgi:septal ring factor EnvC (AmiA/AmiB activator)
MGNKKGMTALLCLVAVTALALCVGLWQKQQARETALRETEASLAESQNSWQTTSAEKEKLQAEQGQVENDLREASLALQESMDKSASIRLQLATLTDLRLEKEAASSAYEQQADTLSGLIQEMQNADNALQEASEAMDASPDEAHLAALRAALRDALLTRRAALEFLIDDTSETEDPATHSSLSLMLVDTEARLAELGEADE